MSSANFPSFLFQKDKEDTLLIKAARLGKEDVLQVLLNAGAAIEATNKVMFALKLRVLTNYAKQEYFKVYV